MAGQESHTLSGRIQYSAKLGMVLAPVRFTNFPSISNNTSLSQAAVSFHTWFLASRFFLLSTGLIMVTILGSMMIVFFSDNSKGSSGLLLWT